ncbi:MAG: HAD family hydrolase [Gammaproteobacteria bacterium]|nr:HAD family hydrolase [Gammaproteobacteria bacterium]
MQTRLFALDFDGVICDSALETGLSGWQVASQIWPDMPTQMPEQILSDFRVVRPVMETGFEAILICRLLFEGIATQLLIEDFAKQIEHILLRENLTVADLKKRFGEYRDNWINTDISSWIEMNPLYPGVKEFLQQIPLQQRFIITTKQERFVAEILSANQIDILPQQIYGLDRKLKKPQILEDLQQLHPTAAILFVEDRLPTLLDVIQTPSLSAIKLFFANWGYNTSADKKQALHSPRITTLETPSLHNLTH